MMQSRKDRKIEELSRRKENTKENPGKRIKRTPVSHSPAKLTHKSTQPNRIPNQPKVRKRIAFPQPYPFPTGHMPIGHRGDKYNQLGKAQYSQPLQTNFRRSTDPLYGVSSNEVVFGNDQVKPPIFYHPQIPLHHHQIQSNPLFQQISPIPIPPQPLNLNIIPTQKQKQVKDDENKDSDSDSTEMEVLREIINDLTTKNTRVNQELKSVKIELEKESKKSKNLEALLLKKEENIEEYRKILCLPSPQFHPPPPPPQLHQPQPQQKPNRPYYHPLYFHECPQIQRNFQYQDNWKYKEKKKKKEMEYDYGPIPNPNLFVHNLPKSYDDFGLYQLFRRFGFIVSAKVMYNLYTGESKGFGFVMFESMEDTNRAKKEMDGKELENCILKIEYSRIKK